MLYYGGLVLGVMAVQCKTKSQPVLNIIKSSATFLMKSRLHIIQASLSCLSKFTKQKQLIQQFVQQCSQRPFTINLNLLNFIIIALINLTQHSIGSVECLQHLGKNLIQNPKPALETMSGSLCNFPEKRVLQSNAFAVVGGDKVHGCLLIGVTLNLSYLTLKNLQSGSENPVLVFGVEFGLFLFNCLYIIGPTR